MPTRFWSLPVAAAAVAAALSPLPALAQVDDAERAAARDLFRQGDELQRAGRFAEALDHFQRAQQAYGAPTNVLHIAECQAALGQVVEAAESYRAVAHTGLPPGAPAAFQAAVEQARGELAQLEPKIPRLLLEVSPPHVPGLDLRIDGQSVVAALVDEPMPLDPGTHRIWVAAPGFAPLEHDAVLREHETTRFAVTLHPLAPASRASPLAPSPTAAPARPAAPVVESGSSPAPPPPPYVGPDGRPAAPRVVEAPPPYETPVGSAAQAPARPMVVAPSRTGLLFGAHLGWELVGGKLPLVDGSNVDASTLANSGLAYGIDGGLRFGRRWYVGLTLEHASLSHGDLSTLGATDASASSTLLGATIGVMGNPDRVSFYGEVGLGIRWLSTSETGPSTTTSTDYNDAEFTLGVGVWAPIGRFFRLVPKVTLGLGSFGDPSPAGTAPSQSHVFAMFGMAGFYNVDF